MNNLENKILEKIKAEKLVPTSVWYFLARDYSLWLLVFLSIVLAAISISPIIFILQNLELSFVKHLTSNIYLFFLLILPYPWMILCAVTTYFATLAWEKTKQGYKFNGFYVFISAFLASLILGIILNLWSFGKMMDHESKFLSRGNYKSFVERRDEFWFNPSEGRTVGIVKNISTSSFRIINENNNLESEINFDEAIPGIEYIYVENKLRIIGYNDENGRFIACSIFPDNLLPLKMNEKREMKDRVMKVFETYPECREIFEQGRAAFEIKKYNLRSR